ncbi:phytoene desaturase family protein [Bacillus sp. DJP31]|uniref:phytoene desaturase family protein n=1 Tax=Bacillus sp. DJP31 TaxID=3409789 RepID=UPI003BB50459
MMKKISIIGGGLGGLSAAITLAHHGFLVDVFEKNDHFGGKLMKVTLGDYSFDFGPNTITMPHVFGQVISQTGEDPDDYIQFEKIDVHTRNFFSDVVFDLSSSKEVMLQQLSKLDPLGAKQYEKFLSEVKKLYELSDKYFLPRTFTSWQDYLSPSLALALVQAKPHTTMHSFIGRYFSNKNVQKSLERYATYVGSSPYLLPATFGMIAYLELVQGVFTVKGGTHKIADAFVDVARKLGVGLHSNSEVKQLIVNGRSVQSIILENGEAYECDEVILNGDLFHSLPKLIHEQKRRSLSDKKIEKIEPSISAFVILAGVSTRYRQLLHHNVFFSKDYKKEFEDLFEHKTYSSDPTIYICNSSFTDKTISPKGDNLFILVNAPSLTDENRTIDKDTYKQMIYNRLEEEGLNIRPYLIEEKVIAPSDIQEQFYAFKGSLYGISSNEKANAFLRPSNKSKDLKNLYFVGGSTHPGGGSPMVTISGMNVAREIVKKQKMDTSKAT